MDGKRSVVLYIIVIVLYFILLPWLTRGRTIGKFLVGIRLMSENKRPPKLFQYILRYGLQYLLVIPAPFIAMKVYELLPLYTGTAHTILRVIALAFGLVFAVFIVQLLISVFTRETQIFYDQCEHCATWAAEKAAALMTSILLKAAAFILGRAQWILSPRLC